MSISLKKAIEELDTAKANLEAANVNYLKAHERFIKAKANQSFRCTRCKTSSKYKDTNLFRIEYTERGLGYSDDVDHFSEWNIECPSCLTRLRFLSPALQEKFEIPMEKYNYYGQERTRQTENYRLSKDFQSKFKSVITFNSNNLARNFVNL